MATEELGAFAPTGKTCPICKQWKPFEDFCFNPARRDGRNGHCKVCQNAIGARRTKKKQEQRQRELLERRATHIKAGTAFKCTGCGIEKAPEEFRRAVEKPRYLSRYTVKPDGESG